ncbi:MAG: hypothetical protein MUC50_04405, partial [Myxococcota bacterium]|nr:hypothetical protein [Myxococcota bacterium]
MRNPQALLLVLAVGLGGCSLIVEGGSPGGTDDPSDSWGEDTGETDTEVTTGPTTDQTDTEVTTGPTTDQTDTEVTTIPTTDETDPSNTDTVKVLAFSINDPKDRYTASRNVQLFSEVGNARWMRLRNENDWWSNWEPFQKIRAWELMGPEGSLEVTAEFRFAVGSPIATAKDSIVLDLTGPKAPTVEREGPFYTNNQNPFFVWTSNGGGMGEYRATVDIEDFTSTEVLYTTATRAPMPTLGHGLHTVFVQEQDEAGNWSESGLQTVFVDLLGPTYQSFEIETSMGMFCTYTAENPVRVSMAFDDVDAGMEQMQTRFEHREWSDWQPYASSFTWDLSPPPEWKAIEVNVRDAAGNISYVSSGIYRDDVYERCM